MADGAFLDVCHRCKKQFMYIAAVAGFPGILAVSDHRYIVEASFFVSVSEPNCGRSDFTPGTYRGKLHRSRKSEKAAGGSRACGG